MVYFAIRLFKKGGRAMRRCKILAICAAIFLSGAFIFGSQAKAAQQDEITKVEKELAAAKKAVEAYRNKLLESPAAANIKKEVAALEASAKIKAKELEGILNAKLNKEPVFIELTAKAKELENANAELAKIRARLDKDPEVAKIRQDAAYMRTKAAELDKEAKKLFESKFNSDEKAKELAAKKSGLANVPKDLVNFKRDVMNSPEVKTLQAEAANLRTTITAKNAELRKIADNAAKSLKTDERIKILEAKVKELGQKLANLRKAPAGVTMPAKPSQNAAKAKVAPKKSLLDIIRRK